MTKLTVVGLGKLGLPLAAVLADAGYDVWGVDLDETRVKTANDYLTEWQEPRLTDVLRGAWGRFQATGDWVAALRGSVATFIVVPTPSIGDGGFDDRYVLAAVEAVGTALRTMRQEEHVVAVCSTVMPGTMGGRVKSRLDETACGARLAYNPFFIALGNVVADLTGPDFVLLGADDEAAAVRIMQIWQRVIPERMRRMGEGQICHLSIINAEIAKLAVNTFVTMKISYANMLAEVCEKLPGADAVVVAKTIGQDHRIGSAYLRPALPYGGPCFPRDTEAFQSLARGLGLDATLAWATGRVNRRQLDRIEGLLEPYGPVAILGLSYKTGTDVTEASPGLMLASRLRVAGKRLVVHDPSPGAVIASRVWLGDEVEAVGDPQAALANVQAAAFMTDHPQYAPLKLTGLQVVVDPWRIFRKAPKGVKLIHIGKG